ncbi:MAG: MFS transporter [Byssovorax cruenta]
MTRIQQLLSIKQGESRMAFLVIGVMLFTSMGAMLGGTGIEALFFARYGVQYLPYMFVGLGIVSMLLSFGVTAVLSRVSKEALYIAIPLLVAVILVVGRLALLSGWSWLYPVLWLGKEVLNFFIGLVTWGVASSVCDTRQAKRLFPLFNASRILGQVIGGFITGLLVLSIGTENLLLVWAATLLLAFVLSRALLSRQQLPATTERISRRRQPKLTDEMQRGYQYVRNSPMMKWISLATILFSVLYFSISLPFSRAATEQYINEDSLATFLGLFNGFSTAAAFLISLLLANKLFARFGIMLSILVLPAIYLIGFASLAILPVFWIIVAFRFVQMLWLNGIADSAWQAMFNVVPPERRDQVRTFISGVPEQAGTFIAGGLLIIGEQTLTPQQLYFVGLFAAAVCTYMIYEARRGYNRALIDALRAGRPHLFYSQEQPFGGFHQDAAAVQTASRGLQDSDPVIRRISAEILGNLSVPESTSALVEGLGDDDALVRAACLRALSQSHAASALLDIAASLSDPEPDVRFEALTAISVLAGYPSGVTKYVAPLLDDEDAKVSTRAAVSILRFSNSLGPRRNGGSEDALFKKAKHHLRQMAVFGDLESREHAIAALGDWGDVQAFEFLANELKERTLVPSIQKNILASLQRINPQQSLPYLIESLESQERIVLESSAEVLGQIGASALEPVLSALGEEQKAEGALLALERLPIPPAGPILDFARAAVARAGEYDALRRGVQAQVRSDASGLLVESLQNKSSEYGIRALRAIGLLGDREAMKTAIEHLQTRDANQRANVIEALESIGTKWREILQPLMRLWEEDRLTQTGVDWDRLLNDSDQWIRECAAFAKEYGEPAMDSLTTLSLMDRILFLKRVPMFAALSPTDLKQVAAIAAEEIFPDGEVIAQQGEPGDAMFVIVSGEVRVCLTRDAQEVEVARRRSGEYVGELSIINREPRNATLIASGDVRALCIDQKSFEGLMRERPEVSLYIIHVLSKRLKELMEK